MFNINVNIRNKVLFRNVNQDINTGWSGNQPFRLYGVKSRDQLVFISRYTLKIDTLILKIFRKSENFLKQNLNTY